MHGFSVVYPNAIYPKSPQTHRTVFWDRMFGVIAETPAIERQSPRLYFAKNIPHPSPRKAICIVLELGLGTHTPGTDLLLGKGWRGSRKVGNLGGDWQAQEMPGLGGRAGNAWALREPRGGPGPEEHDPRLLLLLQGLSLAAPSPLTPRIFPQPTGPPGPRGCGFGRQPTRGCPAAAAAPDPSSGSKAPRKERALQGGTYCQRMRIKEI